MVRRLYLLFILALSLQTFGMVPYCAAFARRSTNAMNASKDVQTQAIAGKTGSAGVTVVNKKIGVEISGDMSFNLFYPESVPERAKRLVARPGALSVIDVAGRPVPEKFQMLAGSVVRKIERNEYGRCDVVSFKALSRDKSLSEKVYLIRPLSKDNVIICKARLKNVSGAHVTIGSYALVPGVLNAKDFGADSAYKFWSFQGGSYPERYDWIFPLTRDYHRQNFQGMNAPDYGGGIPVVDLWTKEMGVAFSVINRTPQFISLPVRVLKSGDVSFSIEDSNSVTLKPGESTELVHFAMITHHGDFFNGLRTYSDLMQDEGFKFPKAPADAYEPEWCAWGYGRDFSKKEILETLPTVKKLGFGWVTIDDGWQNNIGDWEPNPEKFPDGEKGFEAFIDSIHSYGLKVRIWWSPFAAQDSTYSAAHYPSRIHQYGFNIQSKLALEHPGWFILDKKGNRVRVSWWNSYLLCPALPAVRHYFEAFVRKAILKWKVDGFKLDGQDQNMVPECFNPLHHHKSPFASVKAVPVFFKDIYNEATRLKKGFLIQLCPCGTNFSIYNLPYVNQTVASDPLDSWQVRLKGKTFRALYGSHTEAYSGDHVELTNHIWDQKLQKFILHGKPDFASAFAVGAVPASKFTLAGIEQADTSLELNPSRLKWYERWMNIYHREKLSRGVYLNLYDIAFDKPETHVIERGGNFYYFFFAKKHFAGKVELRGLTAGHYTAYNLYTGKMLKQISASHPAMSVSFDHYMVLKLVPTVKMSGEKG